jgi:hypothetical protein
VQQERSSHGRRSPSFVARLFQMHDTKGACLDVIRSTQAAKALQALLDG